MARGGTPASKRHRDSNPDDLAPHYMPDADARAAAVAAGWVEADGRWSCPPCSSRRSPDVKQ